MSQKSSNDPKIVYPINNSNEPNNSSNEAKIFQMSLIIHSSKMSKKT